MKAESITIAFIDTSAGFEASPSRVMLGDLADFTADVESFLRGEKKELDPASLSVAVVSGSFAIQTEPISAAPSLLRDLQALLNSELLDSIDAKRREVIDRWQKAARSARRIAYRISSPHLPRPLTISTETDFRADDADQWVQVERYVRGEILDLGGATKANAHIRLPDGRTLRVTTERAVLRDDATNRLYKQAMLRIKAQYNVLTRELREARLVEFVEYAPSFDEEEIARLTRRGTQAWKGVESGSAWVDELRGGNE